MRSIIELLSETAPLAQRARRGELQQQRTALTNSGAGKVSPHLTLRTNAERDGGETAAANRKQKKLATTSATEKKKMANSHPGAGKERAKGGGCGV